jgi:anti-sigma factor RsiW
MKNFDENELIDKAVAGRLNAEEQRLWAALLAERPELEAELEIGGALRGMPKPPQVSTNFTSVVLQQINRPAAESQPRGWFEWLRLPRLRLARIAGVAVIVVGIGATLVHRQVEQRRVAESVRSFTGGISAVAAKPDVRPEVIMAVMEDFDAIRHLPMDDSYVDDGLLTALTQ